MQKLYQVSWTNIKNREALYFKVQGNVKTQNNALAVRQGGKVDLLTYFNCFSLCQWKKYTTIKKLYIRGFIDGQAKIEIIGLTENGTDVLQMIEVKGEFTYALDITTVQQPVLGLNIIAVTNCLVKEVAYYGDFSTWKPLKIGVSICTFKREQYVKKTMAKLQDFSKQNLWLRTLVVDNGSTLPKMETASLRIIHNPNYGGSGGFTRGLIENLNRQENDYVLLMDDDIDLDTTALTRMYALLCGLKEKYTESFLSGAMLRMENPCIQHENTAYWGKIRLHSLGQGYNLADNKNLLANEGIADYKNQYGAWWFCCIPLKRIAEIGLPLPVFIKGDDMEYGIRNNREVIHMNGIGVWHEAFAGKVTDVINYFSDRNMLIINQYAAGCNRYTLFVAIIGRLVKRLVNGNISGIRYLNLAVADMLSGFTELTKVPSDKKFAEVRAYKSEDNVLLVSLKVIHKAIFGFLNYDSLKKSYIVFRSNELKDSSFWRDFLMMDNKR